MDAERDAHILRVLGAGHQPVLRGLPCVPVRKLVFEVVGGVGVGHPAQHAPVADLGARYHSRRVADLPIEPDIVIECTGLGDVAMDATRLTAPGGVVVLAGISHSEHVTEVPLDAMNKALVLENKTLFGTVNAARRHYEPAAAALSRADPDWLARLITRRLPPEDWPLALSKRPEDIKIVVDMAAAG